MSEGNRQQQVAPHGRTGGLTGRAVAIAAIAVVFVVFLVQNRESTEVSFLMLSFTWPVWLLLLVVFALGVVLGGLVREAIRRLWGKDRAAS